MVKLIVIARCIPEDVYLRSLESPVYLQLAGEKKFPVVVREPEEWPIGRLANEIKTRYEVLYKRQFGQVKYLKDNEDDCDLDPDLTVADLLVDEGKAARDGSDQKKTIKLIQEQGRAIREGSVIPDLTPIHYQPRTLPPIPRFPGTDRRRPEDHQIDDRPTKRRRLDQIEEETNQIVNSIERDALNGNLRNAEPVVEPKIESPELASRWINTGPATRDELELLPEAPAYFRPRSRGGPGDSRRRQDIGPEIRESSVLPQEERQQQNTEEAGHRSGQASERYARQSSTSHIYTPITPSNPATNIHTSGGQVVNMLNSMKSHSPVIRQSPSRSASKFRKPLRNVYDYPESDIDDTQMSPRSRASRTRITPKLVQTPHSKSKPRIIGGTPQTQTQPPSVIQESPSRRRITGGDSMDADHRQELQLPPIPTQERPPSRTKLTNKSLERADREQDGVPVPHSEQQPRDPFNQDRNSVIGSDETWSIHEDGTRRKKSRQSRSQRRSNLGVSTSRSSSLATSAKTTSNTTRSHSGGLKRKRVAPTQVNDRQSRSEFSEMDSPGMQLSETLRRSSPASRPSKEASHNVSESASGSNPISNQQRQAMQLKDVAMDDVERSPDSVSDSEEEILHAKAPKRPQAKNALSQDVVPKDLRCYTCWYKKSICDNKQPKCDKCMKNKKNCQQYSLTRKEFEIEKTKRQAAKNSNAASSQGLASRKIKANLQAELTPQVNSNDSADDETGDEDSVQNTSNANKELQTQHARPKSKSTAIEGQDSASEDQFSTSSGDESTPLNDMPSASRASRSKLENSEIRQRYATESSGKSRSGSDPKTESEREDVKGDPKRTSTSREVQHAQTRGNINGKSLGAEKPGRKTEASPVLHRSELDQPKSPEMSKNSELPLSVENARLGLSATPKDARLMPTENSITHERSFETRVTSTNKILPMGMSEEEYESLVKSRANLTDEQRKEQKLRNRKSDKRAESTPSLIHHSSTQEITEKTKPKTPSVQSTQRGSSSQPKPRNESKPPPSTQPTRAPASIKSNTPMSAPAKVKPGPLASDTSAKTKLKLQPAAANKGVKIKSPNPPFQPHQPQTKPVAADSRAVTTTTPSTLTASRSLKDIRAVLTSQSRSGSGASTPQPARTTAAKIADMRRGVASAAANARKKITSLSDDDEDDEDSSDEDEEDEDEKETNTTPGDIVRSAVKGMTTGNVTVRRRTPSDSGSGSVSFSDTSDAQNESGGDDGSSTDSTSASGSEDDDDDDE